MGKTITKEVFLIINNRHLNIIKEIKEKLLEYNINLNIYKKDDEFKKLLSSDTIVILDNEILLDYGYLNKIESLIRMKRSIHLYKLKDVDVTDLKLFFDIGRLEINTYIENNQALLFKMLTSLKAFHINYFHLYSYLDKKYSKDEQFIRLLEYYLKNEIKDENKLKELLCVSSKEFDSYYELLKKLLIHKLSIFQIRELLPFIYGQVFKKNRYELKLNMVINEIYYQKNYLSNILNKMTIEQFNNEYNEYLEAVNNRTYLKNTFVDILFHLEVIRIIDNEIRNVLPEKDIKSIKLFIENKFISKDSDDNQNLSSKIYLNYIDDLKVRCVKDFHKSHNHNIVDNISDADIVITLVTKKAISNIEFINKIRSAVELNKKLLFIYLDKCDLSLSIKYLIGFSDNICYWAYQRIDKFFIKYLEKINDLALNDIKEINSNIVRLK